MRALVLAGLLLIGCGADGLPDMTTGSAGTRGTGGSGGSEWPMTLLTSWAVRLNGGQTPTCQGLMGLSLQRPSADSLILATGSWNCTQSAADCAFTTAYLNANWQCIAYTGTVQGTITPWTSAVALHANIDADHYVDINGTLGDSAIIGSVMYSDGAVAFDAILQ